MDQDLVKDRDASAIVYARSVDINRCGCGARIAIDLLDASGAVIARALWNPDTALGACERIAATLDEIFKEQAAALELAAGTA